MKYLFFFLMMTFSAATSFAQLAKMQFEDAEAAYSEGKFAEAVKLLDEAEASNKGVNPPIMHLRILSRIELIKQNPEKDFDIIDKARREADLFLKEYDGNAQLEDKYREVYQASKVLKELPLTRKAFGESASKKREAATEAERVRKEKLEKFHSFSYDRSFKKGIDLEAFKKEHSIKEKSIMTTPDGDKKIWLGNRHIIFSGGKSIGYITREWFYSKESNEKAKGLFAKQLAYFTDLFGFEPVMEQKKYTAGASSGALYTWKHGGKTFIMECYHTYIDNEYKSALYCYDYDRS